MKSGECRWCMSEAFSKVLAPRLDLAPSALLMARPSKASSARQVTALKALRTSRSILAGELTLRVWTAHRSARKLPRQALPIPKFTHDLAYVGASFTGFTTLEQKFTQFIQVFTTTISSYDYLHKVKMRLKSGLDYFCLSHLVDAMRTEIIVVGTSKFVILYRAHVIYFDV